VGSKVVLVEQRFGVLALLFVGKATIRVFGSGDEDQRKKTSLRSKAPDSGKDYDEPVMLGIWWLLWWR